MEENIIFGDEFDIELEKNFDLDPDIDFSEYLIIGMGIAGFTAVKEIRFKEPDAMITVVSKNKNLLQYGDRIYKEVYDDFPDRNQWMDSINWYYDHDVELVLGAMVMGIDVVNKVVSLDDGSQLSYNKLLIATGSRLVYPSYEFQNMEGVIIIKTKEDLDDEEFDEIYSPIILGSGLEEVKEALELLKRGKEVTIVSSDDEILRPSLNREISDLVISYMENMGIEIYMSTDIESVNEGEVFHTLTTKDGQEVSGDMLILNKGMKANIENFISPDIAYDIGIKVNEHMETSADNVYAAGDCVEFDNRLVGSWHDSIEQGQVAGRNMVGGKERHRYPDDISIIDFGERSLFTFGQTLGDSYEIFENADGTIVQVFFDSTRDGETYKVIGVVIFGDISIKEEYVEMILLNRR